MRVPILAGVSVLAAVAWVYLLAGHAGYWRADQRPPRRDGDPGSGDWPSGDWPSGDWPSMVAVVPARNEAAVLPLTLPSLLAQDYPVDLGRPTRAAAPGRGGRLGRRGG